MSWWMCNQCKEPEPACHCIASVPKGSGMPRGCLFGGDDAYWIYAPKAKVRQFTSANSRSPKQRKVVKD